MRYCEWQGSDEEAAEVTVSSRLGCTFISTAGINVLNGRLSATFSFATCLLLWH